MAPVLRKKGKKSDDEGSSSPKRPAKKTGASPKKRPAKKPEGSPKKRPAKKTAASPTKSPARKTQGSPKKRPAKKTGGSPTKSPARRTEGSPTKRPDRRTWFQKKKTTEEEKRKQKEPKEPKEGKRFSLGKLKVPSWLRRRSGSAEDLPGPSTSKPTYQTGQRIDEEVTGVTKKKAIPQRGRSHSPRIPVIKVTEHTGITKSPKRKPSKYLEPPRAGTRPSTSEESSTSSTQRGRGKPMSPKRPPFLNRFRPPASKESSSETASREKSTPSKIPPKSVIPPWLLPSTSKEPREKSTPSKIPPKSVIPPWVRPSTSKGSSTETGGEKSTPSKIPPKRVPVIPPWLRPPTSKGSSTETGQEKSTPSKIPKKIVTSPFLHVLPSTSNILDTGMSHPTTSMVSSIPKDREASVLSITPTSPHILDTGMTQQSAPRGTSREKGRAKTTRSKTPRTRSGSRTGSDDDSSLSEISRMHVSHSHLKHVPSWGSDPGLSSSDKSLRTERERSRPSTMKYDDFRMSVISRRPILSYYPIHKHFKKLKKTDDAIDKPTLSLLRECVRDECKIAIKLFKRYQLCVEMNKTTPELDIFNILFQLKDMQAEFVTTIDHLEKMGPMEFINFCEDSENRYRSAQQMIEDLKESERNDAPYLYETYKFITTKIQEAQREFQPLEYIY